MTQPNETRPIPTQVDPLLGATLNERYRVIRQIGIGGMGTVYLCEHLMLGRQVAIKVLHSQYAQDESFVARFLNEGRAAGMLGHPNIVSCSDMGQAPNGAPYLVFDYLDGKELSALLKAQGRFTPVRAVRIGLQIASALATAHEAGIVHRDLKSENIFLLNRNDARDEVKVLDFGISKFRNSAATAGLMMGTPKYMAPEQVLDPAGVDARADVYSLGVILFFMLTGRLPFDDDAVPTVLNRIVHEPPPDLREHISQIDHALADYVMRMLGKKPDERPESMRAVEAALGSWARLDSNSLAGTPPPGFQPPLALTSRTGPTPTRRGPAIVAAGGLVGALVIAAVVWAITRSPVQPPAPAPIPLPVVEAPKPAEPVNVALSVDSPTPGARVAFRGRAFPLPYLSDVKAGSNPEAIEVGAPGFVTRKFWVVLSETRKLSVELTPGSGAADATEFETAVALGNAELPSPPKVEPPVTAPPPKPVAIARKDSTVVKTPAPAPEPIVAVAPPTPPAPTPPAPTPAAPVEPPKVEVKVTPPPEPTAPVGPAPGTMDPLATKQAVSRQVAAAVACVERARMDAPQLAGKVVLHLTVAPDGTISNADATSELNNARADACIVAEAKKWQLPQPAGGVPARINYPLVFK